MARVMRPVQRANPLGMVLAAVIAFAVVFLGSLLIDMLVADATLRSLERQLSSRPGARVMVGPGPSLARAIAYFALSILTVLCTPKRYRTAAMVGIMSPFLLSALSNAI